MDSMKTNVIKDKIERKLTMMKGRTNMEKMDEREREKEKKKEREREIKKNRQKHT